MHSSGEYARAVTVLAGGAALGQGVAVLVSPIFAHLYSPADLGVFGIYALIPGILTVVASLHYELAILLPKDEERAASYPGALFF